MCVFLSVGAGVSCLDCYTVRMAGGRAVGSSYKHESTWKCTVLMFLFALFV